MRKSILAFAASLGLATSLPAFSDVLVDTGPGGTSTIGSPSLFGDNGSGDFQFLAGEFTLTQAATITAVSGWMVSGFTGDFVIKLYADGGSAPGTEIAAQFFDDQFVEFAAHWENFGGLNWDVAAGTYWVAFEPQPGNFNGAMPKGAANPLSGYAFFAGGNSNYFSLGSSSLGFMIEGTLAPVPEPETWAMLLAGLGLVGAMARRQREEWVQDRI